MFLRGLWSHDIYEQVAGVSHGQTEGLPQDLGLQGGRRLEAVLSSGGATVPSVVLRWVHPSPVLPLSAAGVRPAAAALWGVSQK